MLPGRCAPGQKGGQPFVGVAGFHEALEVQGLKLVQPRTQVGKQGAARCGNRAGQSGSALGCQVTIKISQSRRFGVAIALVLLLILFTLALSIVLKPRGRDMPPELSSLGSPASIA